MILQALNEYYDKLLEDPDSGVAPPGYSPAKVSHAIVINPDGELIDILPLSVHQGKKSIPKLMLVPEQVKRTSGISANILCDNLSYILGIEVSKQGILKISDEKYYDFKIKNEKFISQIKCDSARAVATFFEQWEPKLDHPIILENIDTLLDASNLVFKIDSSSSYVHENIHIKNAWQSYLSSNNSEWLGQCLILGTKLPIARVHPAIKGVVGAQTSGAMIVSFNVDAFTSYGKTQSYNAPVSEKAAFAYGTALNYLIASDTNRVRLADTTIVFWADRKGGKTEEVVLAWSLDPVMPDQDNNDNKSKIDPSVVRQAKTILERAKIGLPITDATFDAETRCYLLGLAPNVARLSVRFWQVNTFGNLLNKIALHYKDLDIDGLERIGSFISPWRILKALAVQEEAKNIPPLLGGHFLKSILSGQAYPQTLFMAVLARCRTSGEHGGVTTIRAAMVKAFLLRKYRIQNQFEKEAMVTVSLNESNTNTAYRLGRLFSLMEKVQKDALGNQINATIRDRYFGAASATPASVFPLLLRLSRHHISKAAYGDKIDRTIQEVLSEVSVFPSHLNMEDQGQFILGYYHQNQANYKKNQEAVEGEIHE